MASLLHSKPCDILNLECCTLNGTVRGLPAQGITEIAGEAGTGKTQFCLLLSLSCQLPLADGGLGGGAAYLSCCEGQFPAGRLAQLARHFGQRHNLSENELLDKVQIEECHNSDEALESILHRIPTLCANNGTRILILDSLAGMLRVEYNGMSSEEMRLRTHKLFLLAEKLKWISDTYHLCVVVVNQVSHSDPELTGQ